MYFPFCCQTWGTKYDAINCFEKQLCEYFNESVLGFCENTQVETEVQARGGVVYWRASAGGVSAGQSGAGARELRSAS